MSFNNAKFQLFLRLPSCFPPLLMKVFLPFIKMMTLPQNSMKINCNSSSIHAPEICMLIQQRNYILENLKKKKLLVALEIQMCLV